MRVEANPDHVKATAFFERVLSFVDPSASVKLVMIAHFVDSARPFIPAMNERFGIQALLAKPSSVQLPVREFLSGSLPNAEHVLDKDRFRQDPAAVIRETFPRNDTGDDIGVVISDIGGYFAPSGSLEHLCSIAEMLDDRGYRLVGVVEDTQNGHYRYRDGLRARHAADLAAWKSSQPTSPIDMAEPDLPGPPFQVYSVAESPLKQPENHLVGVAVTFSIEAILRQSNVVLQSRRAGVIGFGPIGASVAHALRNRGIPVSICERNPIRLAQAAAQGFRVYHYEHHFDDFVREINLLVSATGAGSSQDGVRPLNAAKAALLKPGTYIASVTSADDEIDLDGISVDYQASELNYNPDVAKWTKRSQYADGTELGSPHSFYLLLGGNAVNFRHDGVIGPAIQLLQGEIAMCVRRMVESYSDSRSKYPYEVCTLSIEDRSLVADMWLDQYISDSGMSD